MHRIFYDDIMIFNEHFNEFLHVENLFHDSQSDFFSLVARNHGILGLQFIHKQQIKHYEELIKHTDDINDIGIIHKRINDLKNLLIKIDTDIKKDNLNNYYDKIKLFSDMLKHIPAHSRRRILSMFDHDKINTNLLFKVRDDQIWNIYGVNADYELLWERYKISEIDLHDEKKYLLSQKFTWWDSLLCVITQEHIKHAWQNNHNIIDLAADICAVNGNLAIVSGLAVTLAFPFYVFNTVSSLWFEGDVAAAIYLYGVIAAGVFETFTIIISIRNIISINLLEHSNLKFFVNEHARTLLLPISLNISGFICFFIALLAHSYCILDIYFLYYFLFVLVIPALVALTIVSIKEVQTSYKSQPWYMPGVRKWSDLSDSDIKEFKKSQKILSNKKSRSVYGFNNNSNINDDKNINEKLQLMEELTINDSNLSNNNNDNNDNNINNNTMNMNSSISYKKIAITPMSEEELIRKKARKRVKASTLSTTTTAGETSSTPESNSNTDNQRQEV